MSFILGNLVPVFIVIRCESEMDLRSLPPPNLPPHGKGKRGSWQVTLCCALRRVGCRVLILVDGHFDLIKRKDMQKISVSTNRREVMVDITSSVEDVVGKAGISSGLCVLYCPHTTAAITVNEGADPSVAEDMVYGLRRLIPGDWDFSHMEGNSDAHIKASLIGPSETVIIDAGRIVLGIWQRIFFCEFDGPRKRVFFVKLLGQEGAG